MLSGFENEISNPFLDQCVVASVNHCSVCCAQRVTNGSRH